jgi:hypothetical protein
MRSGHGFQNRLGPRKSATPGGVAEWSNAPVLKTGVGPAHRGFESHRLRHLPPRKRSPDPAAAGFFRCFRGLSGRG